VTADEAGRFAALVELRARRVPLQHLTGTAPFRHLELRVGPGVFIPRPETELLVDTALHHLRAGPSSALVVDLCTGSGALALSLALEAPGCRVVAVEASGAALEWARANLADHASAIRAARSSAELVAADATAVAEPGGALEHLRARVDLVVSNPPYIPEGAVPRDPEVRDHDPAVALFGGPDGLDVIRKLQVQAAALLREGGMVLIEHADAQGEDAAEIGVPALLRDQPARAVRDQTGSGEGPDGPAPAWREVVDHLDLSGRPRYTSAIRAGGPR
jgi:release factor glutamine methyltransferase